MSLGGREPVVTVAGVFANRVARGYAFEVFDTVAIELVRSYGMPVGAEVFDTCIEIGRFVEVAEAVGAIVDLIPRQHVKLELCGSPRAKDPNIRAALIDIFGGPGAEKKGGPLAGVKSHAWAALAVAVTCARIQGRMKRA